MDEIKELKTICSDVYGREKPKEMAEFREKHAKAIYEVPESFVKDCVKNNIEYCSANGMFWSLAMGQ